MAQRTALTSGTDKRGGYTGGGSAAKARPPRRIPSGIYLSSKAAKKSKGSDGTK